MEGDMSRVWAFDLDNTLIEASRFYGYAILDFIRLMMEVLEWKTLSWWEIGQLVSQVDRELVERWGASRDRFPAALMQCYRRLCDFVEVPCDEAVSRAAWRIGEKAFASGNYSPRLIIPGVENVLNCLSRQDDKLFIVTKGDPVVQRRKWQGCKFQRWFPRDHFLVVRWEPAAGYSGDKTGALLELCERYPYCKCYMVGDSIKDDILPALRAGMTGIHIPSNWRWHSGEPPLPLPNGAIRLKRIAEILEVFPE